MDATVRRQQRSVYASIHVAKQLVYICEEWIFTHRPVRAHLPSLFRVINF